MATLILSAIFTILLAGLIWVALKLVDAAKRNRRP